MIQEITDEDVMSEDMTVESASTAEITISVNSGATVVEMETSGHKIKHHHMDGPFANVHLYNNSSPYDFLNLMMSEEFSSGILQE